MPAILHRNREHLGKIYRLALLPSGTLPGWKLPSDYSGLRPPWLKQLAPTEPIAGYLPQAGLRTFLEGGVPSGDEVVAPHALFALDYRTGISIAPDRLTSEAGRCSGVAFWPSSQA